MPLVERFIDVSKKLAKPTLLAGTAGAALFSADCGGNNPSFFTPGIRITVDNPAFPRSQLIEPDPTAIELPVWRPFIPTNEEWMKILASSSEELTPDQFRDVYDYYYNRAMAQFKSETILFYDEANIPRGVKGGVATFETTDGYKMVLEKIDTTAGTFHFGDKKYNRNFKVYNYNAESELVYPGNIVTTNTHYFLGDRDQSFLSTTYRDTSDKIDRTTVIGGLTPVQLADIAKVLDKGFTNAVKNNTLPQTFKVPESRAKTADFEA